MTTKYGELVSLAQEKIEADVYFQNSLVDLSDEDKEQALSAKQEELIDAELEALDTKATKAEEIARNQKIRAEKAEAEAKKPKMEKETPKNNVLSRKEQILESRALNSLHEDDIEEVVAIAETKGISLTEAIKNPYVKAFIQTRNEERKTAEATNTGTSKRQNLKTDKSAVLKRSDNYELAPEEMKDAAKAVIESVFGK